MRYLLDSSVIYTGVCLYSELLKSCVNPGSIFEMQKIVVEDTSSKRKQATVNCAMRACRELNNRDILDPQSAKKVYRFSYIEGKNTVVAYRKCEIDASGVRRY